MPFSDEKFRIVFRDGVVANKRLALVPEPNLLACLCEWEPADGCPVEFYREYLERSKYWDQGWVGIFWCVAMEGNGTWLSPFPYDDADDTYLIDNWFHQWRHWPVSSTTGHPLDWFRLPIMHRFPEFWDELGWSPAPFQKRFYFSEVFDSRDARCPRDSVPDGWML